MEHDSNILVTGVDSGLGKHCLQHFRGKGLSRNTAFAEVQQQAAVKPYRAIIHCAFNTNPEITSSQLYAYLNDTILLVRKLLQVPHEKFILISSADVYERTNDRRHTETEEISVTAAPNLYVTSKLICESMVQHEAANFLILRTSALLGQHSRKNSLIKILTQKKVSLTLAAASTFNYVLHTDVSEFIEKALADDLTGIYNLAAVSNTSLQEVATLYQRQVEFGHFHYATGGIDNEKAKKIMNNFARTSLENIALYLAQNHSEAALQKA